MFCTVCLSARLSEREGSTHEFAVGGPIQSRKERLVTRISPWSTAFRDKECTDEAPM